MFGSAAHSSRRDVFADELQLELVESTVPLSLSFVACDSFDALSANEGENEEDRFYESLFRVDDPLSLSGLLDGYSSSKTATSPHFLTVKGLPRNVLLAVERVASVVNVINRPNASVITNQYR
jgi:hypothetical protein